MQECNEDGTEPDQLRIVARIASSTASSSAAASPATTTTLTTTPQHILRLELAALRSALQQYLDRSCRKKQLRIPGGGYQKPRHDCRRGCSGAFFTPPSASVENGRPRRRIYGSGEHVYRIDGGRDRVRFYVPRTEPTSTDAAATTGG